MKQFGRPSEEHGLLETAAHLASNRVPTATPHASAAETLRGLVGKEFDSASHLAVIEGDQFRGVLRLEALLAADDDVTVADLMDSDAPFVAPGVDQEIAAWTAVRHGESALAVTDENGRFVGMIPPVRLLGVLLSEHDEDLTRLGGFIKSASSARSASTEPVERRFVHRLPWLLVGLAGALLAADIVGQFEHNLEQTLKLAFFIPGMVYLADAVGTQTETVVIRGLSVGVAIRRMVVRELLAGAAIGTALAILGGLLIWWRWGDAQVALVVGLALLVACSTATLAAMLLPWLFSKAGRDPAFGSGPLATVIQDLLTIIIYFAIASALIR